MVEDEWIDRIYGAAEDKFDRDPDLHHETVVAQVVSAALAQLADIAESEGHIDVARFVRAVTI